MKKYFFFAACASVAFASCVNNDVPEAPLNEQHVITFDTPVVQPNSRGYGNEIGTAYKNDVEFKAFAWYNSDGSYTTGEGVDFFDDWTSVAINENNWYPYYMDGDTKKFYYWPKEGSLTFLAYSPASLTSTSTVTLTNKSLNISSYEVKNDGTAHTDLLVSDKTYDEEEQPSDAAIHFHHALSSILFNAKLGGNYAGATVKLTGIELTKINSKGNFFQNLDDMNGKVMRLPIKTKGKTDDVLLSTMPELSTYAPSWNSDTPVDYTVGDIVDQVLTTDLYYPSTGNANRPAEATVSSFRESDFILIPQTIADDAKLVVSYKLKVGSGLEVEQVTTMKLNTITSEWEMGYRYVYNIVISLSPITFEPTVQAWVDAKADPGFGVEP